METYIENKKNYIYLKKQNQYQNGGSKSLQCAEKSSKFKIPKNFVVENLDKFKKAFDEPLKLVKTETENKKRIENTANDSDNNSCNSDNDYYDERYSIDSITVTMFDKNWEPEKINLKNIDLTKDVHTVYLYQKGIHDVKPWYFIGKLKGPHINKKYYVYFEADCDYTGFYCQGAMTLYISEHFSRIIQLALPEKVRVKFNKKIHQAVSGKPIPIQSNDQI